MAEAEQLELEFAEVSAPTKAVRGANATDSIEITTPEVITTSELIELCAADGNLFETEFFPDTVRQESAPFHNEVWRNLESSARLAKHLSLIHISEPTRPY